MAGLDEIRQRVLSMGPEAVVVEPAELKVLMWNSLKETPKHYCVINENKFEMVDFDTQPKIAS